MSQYGFNLSTVASLKINKKILFTGVFVILLFCPWLDNKKIATDVYSLKAKTDGTFGSPCQDDGYFVSWVPFGRWAASCEAGWYITFWGMVL